MLIHDLKRGFFAEGPQRICPYPEPLLHFPLNGLRGSQHWPEVPPRLEAMVLRCLAKEPDERYRTVAELLRDLESLSA